jgi:hypothetical protein
MAESKLVFGMIDHVMLIGGMAAAVVGLTTLTLRAAKQYALLPATERHVSGL